MLTDEQLDRARCLAVRLAGIELGDRHRELLQRRGARHGVPDGAAMDALLGAAESGDDEARRRFIGLITTAFTGFFRHPRHFELAAEHALGAAHRRGVARLWSAAAATGEEPYSLAMSLIEIFGRDDPPVTILATDINEAALSAARRGEYAGPVPAAQRTRFFSPATDGRRWRISQAVRDLVEFRPLNLTDAAWPVAGPFDVVFCRNVLMYLEAGRRGPVLERITSVLAPDGMLLLDPAEHLGNAAPRFTGGAEGVYRLRSRHQAGRHPAGCAPA